MNIDDLWIGDEVYVSSLNKNARWEGKSEGRARIRHGELLIWVPLSEISEARIFHENKDQDSGTASKRRSASASLIGADSASPPRFQPAEIDLHMEVLAPDRRDLLPEAVLDFQLRCCRAFVEEAIRLHRPSILIIHGKGKGLLRQEVALLLQDFREVQFCFERHEGGATEVLLRQL